ncbi:MULTISPECIES: ABC transporter permease [unclassified Aureimonas]|uniref:ABC transporter permease n=1 Tax=unclassified Aureimonas TaxID=2615206 RepID=UPI000701B7F0|nr:MULTISPECIES: ABC transporter permease [unclassified Aureimonas]KQT57372.1 ABC transporter permease [Aureimonas sp. Leaf427]KQT77050.1 ABC transporter permease [Aureimonas sp. Leaf460]
MSEILRRFGGPLGSTFLLLVALWLAGLVLVPNLTMLDFALRPNLPPAQLGGPKDVYSATNFLYLLDRPAHVWIFLKTVWGSAVVTLATLVLCYPLAYWLAQTATRRQVGLVLLVLAVPYLMNEVLRGLAWYIILAFEGPLNQMLTGLGLLSEPMRWYGDGGVLAGMAYAYLLFMLFPIYNSIGTLDRAQIEAARDLGAGTIRIHRRVVLPHAKVGIATGCVFTFMLAAGSYIAPALLGAPGSRWFTQLIYDWFFESGNWNRGAAYGLTLLLLCIAAVLGMLRLFRVDLASAVK